MQISWIKRRKKPFFLHFIQLACIVADHAYTQNKIILIILVVPNILKL